MIIYLVGISLMLWFCATIVYNKRNLKYSISKTFHDFSRRYTPYSEAIQLLVLLCKYFLVI